MKAVKEEADQGTMGEIEGIDKAATTASQTPVSTVGQLILAMVDKMQVGTVEGKNFASMDISTEANVPEAFAGSHLTLSFEENGLVIHFDNFDSPQQEQNAINLIENNKEQLTQMLQALQTKNIQLTEFNVGNQSITLPRVEPLPPPLQPTPRPPTGGEAERERGERERGEEG